MKHHYLVWFLSLPLAVMAQDVFNVDTGNNLQIISQGVTGIGMLDRVSSSAFAKSTTFQNAIRDYGAGSVRWPNAGHDNLLLTHWDNDHTIYFGAGDDYTTQAAGNIWDPLYNTNDAAPRTELIDLDAFVDVLNHTGVDPIMLFTWRSGELWSTNGSGDTFFYRDPAPLRMDGSAMPPAEADLLSGRELQFLENRRQLQGYNTLDGPDYPVVQIGGEVFIGWDTGIEPWVLYGANKGEWIASTLRSYFTNLNDYAEMVGGNLRLMAQFKEANSGGHEIPTSVTFLRGEFDKLIDQTGDLMTYYGCSMHYRHDYATWLNQSNMTWGFIVDGGEGTAQEIQDWVKSYTAGKGYPGIQLIPHANGIGSDNETLITNDYSRFREGLVNTQFMMELIEAGYPYACQYGGIKGEYEGSVGLNDSGAISYMDGTGYQYNPVLHATSLIGEAVMEQNARPARLVGMTLASGNADGKTQVIVVEPSADQSALYANGGPLSTNITQVLYAYVLNKRGASQAVTLDFNQQVQGVFEVNRYSEGSEETAPAITPASGVVVRDGVDKTRIHITAAPYSMTRVKVFVKGVNATTNRPPAFKSSVIRARKAETGVLYSQTLSGAATDGDGDTLSFSKISGPGWLSIASNGSLGGTPLTGDMGLNSFDIRVSDGQETQDSVLRIQVTDQPIPNTPAAFKVNPISKPSATADNAYYETLADRAHDADNDPLIFSKVSGGPAWLNVAADGIISGTPGAGDIGPNVFIVQVTDGNGETNSATLNIVVNSVLATGFVGWDSGTPGFPDHSTITGLDATLAGADANLGASSDDQTWGSLGEMPLPGTGNTGFRVKNNYVVSLTAQNNTGTDLLLDGIYLDYNWEFVGGPPNFTLEYTSGDLGSGPYTLYSTSAVDQVYHNYDFPFSGALTNRTLGSGQSAVFSLTFTGGAASRSALDNIMLKVQKAVDTNLTAYGAWASFHSLTNGPAGNDDNDALINLYEFGLGGNPTNPADIGILPAFGRSGSVFQYIYPRRTAPDSGLTYYLELTDDLVSGVWTNSGYTETGVGDINGTFESVTNEIPSAGKTNEFIRLKIIGAE